MRRAIDETDRRREKDLHKTLHLVVLNFLRRYRV
jgi:hypothetical protein